MNIHVQASNVSRFFAPLSNVADLQFAGREEHGNGNGKWAGEGDYHTWSRALGVRVAQAGPC